MTEKEKFYIIAERIKKAKEPLDREDEYGNRVCVSCFDDSISCFKEYDEDYFCYDFNQDDFEFDFFIEHFGYPYKFLWEDLIDD